MRRSAFLLVLAAISGSPAVSSTLVTTAQVEQLLISSRGRPDIEVAAEISGLELSERVSSERLDRWEKSFPGNHTHDALIALADSSEFHDLPAADRASAAPPNLLGQQQMLSRVIDYVSQAIPKLPNFFATRHTTSFEDIKQELSQQSAVSVSPQLLHSLNSSNIAPQLEHQPLQVVGTSTLAVTYRDGREVVDTQRAKDLKLGSEEAVFTTRGEFGPILGLVLGDAVRSSITWGHWEQSASGLHGVFHYSVPQAKSHYMVAFPGRMGPEQQFPAYHGEIMFDPASGSILRMTVIPNLKPPTRWLWQTSQWSTLR